MKTIYLLRHTTPDIDLDVCYGQMNVNVKAENFKSESKRIFDLLRAFPSINSPRIYSSPLKRCKVLANALPFDKEVLVDDRLIELDFGKWEGVPWKEIPKTELDIWMEAFPEMQAPGGESYRQMQERVLRFWREVLDGGEDAYIVVAHGGSLRTLISHILEMPLKRMFSLNMDFGSVSAITVGKNKTRLHFLNRQ